jgi:hypothetical protein
MLLNLTREVSIRGAVFEHGSLILLRRQNKNNFIFLVKRFDTLFEIVDKYRFDCSQVQDLVNFVGRNGCFCDLVEFVVDDILSRKVLKLNFYEVKTRRCDSKRKYFETCLSNHDFMIKVSNLSAGTFLVGLILFEDWRFSFNVHVYSDTFLRVYDSSEKKTVFFSRAPRNEYGDEKV